MPVTRMIGLAPGQKFLRSTVRAAATAFDRSASVAKAMTSKKALIACSECSILGSAPM